MSSLASILGADAHAASTAEANHHAKEINSLTNSLLRRNLKGNAAMAAAVVKLYKLLVQDIAKTDSTSGSILPVDATASDVHNLIAEANKVLTQAAGSAFIVGNICARVLRLIDEEAEKVNKPASAPPTVESVRASARAILSGDATTHATPASASAAVAFATIKEGVLDALNELNDELETANTSIVERLHDVINADDTVLTIGGSSTILHFLLAAKKLKPTVFVAERAPALDGHQMAALLATKLNSVVAIPDSAVAATLSRVNKVILGAQAVCADGSVVTKCGTFAPAAAAKAANIPVIVICNSLKIVPTSVATSEKVVAIATASETFAADTKPSDFPEEIDVVTPEYDILPAEFITVIITNTQVVTPAQVNRISSELYGE